MSSVTSDTSLEQTARVITLCLLAFLSLTTSADTLTGKVIKVADGDSITVLDNTNTRAASPVTQKRPPQIAPETRSRKRWVAGRLSLDPTSLLS